MSRMRFSAVLCLAGLLALTVILGCGDDTSPTGTDATGSLAVIAGPEDVDAAWSLRGPGGYALEGSGSREITGLAAGIYELTWQGAEGWVRPWPDVVRRELIADAAIVVQGEYRENLPSTVTIAPDVSVTVSWTLRGSEGLVETGVGERTFEDVDSGHYSLSWDVPEGWVNAGPVVPDGDVYGGEIAFTGAFVRDVETPEGFEYVPPGTFTMGTPMAEWGRQIDEVEHEVTLTRGFMMQTEEVDFTQYRDLVQWAYENEFMRVDVDTIQVAGSEDLTFEFHARENTGGTDAVLIHFTSTDLEFIPRYTAADTFYIFQETDQVQDGDVADRPISGISWYGAAAYCNWLSEQEGLEPAYDTTDWSINGGDPYGAEGYRLPTEAEWEWACRAGTNTAFSSGVVINPTCNDPNLNRVGWHCAHGSDDGARLEANAWGLYDLHGNVWEWCQDWWTDYSAEPVTDPSSESVEASAYATDRADERPPFPYADRPIDDGADKFDDPVRIVRGGGASSFSIICRSGNRARFDPWWTTSGTGFRVVRTIDAETR